MIKIPADLILENERVLLRPLAAGDEELLLPFAFNEAEIWTYSLQSAAGEAGMHQYVQDALADFTSGWAFPFIVFDKQTGSVAGSTRYYDINFAQKSLQIGYTWYGKNHRGTGLNKNCKFLLLQYAFEALEFERVEFRADANNSRSVAAMKSIGCVEEGILRNHVFKSGGGRRDSIILSILHKEWLAGVKNRLLEKIQNLP
jgi:RimJ/RimL family protein N-acetyltransferase